MRNIIKIYPDHLLIITLLLFLISPLLISSARHVCVCNYVFVLERKRFVKILRVSATDRWCFEGDLLFTDPEVTETSRGKGRCRGGGNQHQEGLRADAISLNQIKKFMNMWYFKIISQFDIIYQAVRLLRGHFEQVSRGRDYSVYSQDYKPVPWLALRGPVYGGRGAGIQAVVLFSRPDVVPAAGPLGSSWTHLLYLSDT